MRFSDLAGLIDLPLDAIEHRFRNEHVLAVLPVHGGVAGRDALLIATPQELALVIAVPGRADYWTTYLEPWAFVELGAIESEADIHRLPIQVEGLVLSVEQWGPQGHEALYDFVEAAASGQAIVATAT
jgi:hypothetical protein